MSAKLTLKEFLPYRLSVLSNRISGDIARYYQDAFGLSIPEWRVMATLGEAERLSAGTVSERTAMDKVQVSRAVSRLLERKFLTRKTDSADKRRVVLSLTKKGREIYDRIAPVALEYETAILERLSHEERQNLGILLAKLAQIQDKIEFPK